jgi:hypothetical protein
MQHKPPRPRNRAQNTHSCKPHLREHFGRGGLLRQGLTELRKIKFVDKDIDCANWIVLATPILQAFREERGLPAIHPLNEAPHPILPRIISRESHNEAFSHSQGQKQYSPSAPQCQLLPTADNTGGHWSECARALKRFCYSGGCVRCPQGSVRWLRWCRWLADRGVVEPSRTCCGTHDWTQDDP